MTYKPSKYQEAIYDFIKNGKGNAIIQAVAGSGKTTTLVDACKLLPTSTTNIFVAFNTSIVAELKSKLPPQMECKTLHSVGFSLFRSNFVDTTLQNDKLQIIIENVLIDNDILPDDSRYMNYYGVLKALIPLLKANNITYNNYNEVEDVCVKGDYELNDDLFEVIVQVMDKCKKNTSTIDFDDMIWLPVVLNFKAKTYDYVFVDETQDLNKVQFELIKKISNGNTRVIAVGDYRQSIYAFRGADTNSMKNLKDFFNMKELPLSICYRCPKSHIKMAQEITSEIEASETAIEGVLEYVNLNEVIKLAEEKNLILCRTNAPLIKVAFKLIREGKKAVVRGRNIGTNIMTVVKKYKAKTLNDLELKIANFEELQNEKLELIEEGKLDKRKKNSILANIDICETILAISESCETIEDLKSKIETIFTDEKVGIVCSSIHKAKGLEADKVFIIEFSNMPHPMAHTDEEVAQEMNIKYVALTRSKRELYIVE